MTWKIEQGNVMDVLRKYPDGYFHCSITSPPYWQMRLYGTDPVVWDETYKCSPAGHTWGDPIPRGHSAMTNQSFNERWGNSAGAKKQEGGGRTGGNCGRFCTGCNAWLGELGGEPDPADYIRHIVQVCREIYRVLRDDGTFWLNIGDGYLSEGGNAGQGKTGQRADRSFTAPGFKKSRGFGLGEKQLMFLPERIAIALQDDGWICRSRIVWQKKNPLPAPVRDRPVSSHEVVLLLTKKKKYFYDYIAVREPHVSRPQRWSKKRQPRDVGGAVPPQTHSGSSWCPSGRNLRDVWSLATGRSKVKHYAVFPKSLVERPIKAGTSELGCCPTCGEPWRRVLKPRGEVKPLSKATDEYVGAAAVTAGWFLNCDCEEGSVPCMVLDPFAGLGTTGLACIESGRDFVGVELSTEHAQNARLGLMCHEETWKQWKGRMR